MFASKISSISRTIVFGWICTKILGLVSANEAVELEKENVKIVSNLRGSFPVPVLSKELDAQIAAQTIDVHEKSQVGSNTVSDLTSAKNNQENNLVSSNIDLGASSKPSLHGPLQNYFDSVNKYIQRQAIIFKWNPEGILEKVSSFKDHDKANWLTETTIRSLFARTSPSEHGKVAMLYNNDVADGYKWSVYDVAPPVPMMFYSLPFVNASVPQFMLVPNPYDRDGGSLGRIERLRRELFEKPTFDQFRQRNSTIVWRGNVHQGDESRKLLVALANVSGSWLDVADMKTCSRDKYLDVVQMSANYKYQIDIGGVSGTSWDGLRWKMCGSGGLVFRVETYSKDWWHDSLVPWKHYVPVKADLSDLQNLYHWAELNQEKVYDITLAGREECLRTSSIEFAKQTQREIIESLPPSSSEVVAEADSLLEYTFQL